MWRLSYQRPCGNHRQKRESYLRLVCSDDQELYRETAAAVKLEERMGSFLLLPALVTREFPRPFETGQII